MEIGLQELGITPATIKDLFIFYVNSYAYGKNVAKFLQEEWQTHLGINITPQMLEHKTFFSNLHSTNFHLALSRWQPWIKDPLYTLQRFLHSKNYSKWSHQKFKQLIKKAMQEIDEKKRKELLMESELILIRELPIIPLFHTNYQFIKKKSFLFRPNHMLLDFKWARFI